MNQNEIITLISASLGILSIVTIITLVFKNLNRHAVSTDKSMPFNKLSLVLFMLMLFFVPPIIIGFFNIYH